MSTAGVPLITWEEFLELPDPHDGHHYELHDGEIIVVPPPRPVHLLIQRFITEWLSNAAQGQGRAMSEFPYRPAANLQFWYADVAFIPKKDMEAMLADDYAIYAPPLIIELLSPSNRQSKIQRQRIAAFSAGTREFWVADPEHKTVELSCPGTGARLYTVNETVPVSTLPGVSLAVAKLFDPETLTS